MTTDRDPEDYADWLLDITATAAATDRPMPRDTADRRDVWLLCEALPETQETRDFAVVLTPATDDDGD